MYKYEKEYLALHDARCEEDLTEAEYTRLCQRMTRITEKNPGFFHDLDTRYVPSSERPFKGDKQ